MNCIAYFDLLGTKGFCDNKDIYFKNITLFHENTTELSTLLRKSGKVGIFSDCAYAECSDEYLMINFLIKLRDRLSAHGLFFNAVIKKGNLGVENASKNNTYGVVFKNSVIADLYITHSQFKGIGILIDDELANEIQSDNIKLVTSSYICRENRVNDIYSTKNYYDVAFSDVNEPRYSHSYEDFLIDLLKQWLQAHSKSAKYGSYYISLFITLLRSFDNLDFSWDMTKKELNCPFVFKILINILSNKYGDFDDYIGLEYLVFTILDIVYSNKSLKPDELIDITSVFMKYPCVNKKYKHSLEEIPKDIFLGKGNREQLIKNCQEEISSEIISKYINTQ